VAEGTGGGEGHSFLDSHYVEVVPYLFEGLLWTLGIAVAGLAIGFVLGAAAGLGRISAWRGVRWATTVYVEVVRGTPILAQVYFIYFGLPEIVGFDVDKVSAAIAAIAVNAGAYIAEIVRGAVESIDCGQAEAGRSLGLSHGQTMRYVIWPQAFHRMIPPLGNQFIISLKDTALFSVIAVPEILYEARQYSNTTFAAFEAMTMACLFYLAITVPASLYLRRLERRMAGP